MELHNENCTCWNCPAIDFTGRVDLRAGRQSVMMHTQNMGGDGESNDVAECKRRPELGRYDPMTITFGKCPEWQKTDYGYLLKNMRVMILGIDGYLGWTLALWLGSLGCRVSGVDNYARRDWVMERGAHTIVPITRMTERLRTAREVLGIDIEFRNIDIFNQRNLMREFIDEVKRRDLNFEFHFETRAGHLEYEDFVALKKIGLSGVAVGVESGDPNVLKRIRKGITVDMARSTWDRVLMRISSKGGQPSRVLIWATANCRAAGRSKSIISTDHGAPRSITRAFPASFCGPGLSKKY
jgi:hypothetical protein